MPVRRDKIAALEGAQMNAAGLNHEFGIPGAVMFQERDGLLQVYLVSAAGTAEISLQGGHVFSWRMHDQTEPLLWLSRDAKFAAGKSLRGGIPVCWPWFGPHSEKQEWPAHGFARTAPWQVVDSDVEEGGDVRLKLALPQEAMPAAMWPHATELSLEVRLGSTLSLELATRNAGDTAFILGEALHTYLNISDIGGVSVSGLDGVEYWDTVGRVEKKIQSGPIAFDAETDRVYIDSPQPCTIEDPGYARRIQVRKQGSLSTVVWNPWTAKAERMGDLGQPEGWRQMLCVESANAWDNKIDLAPGESHTLSVEYAVEALR
jgi:D-hexose-6-phosphate mutarotase